MKLDRNSNVRGRGKYAILKLRKVDEVTARFNELGKSVLDAMRLLEREGILDWGDTPGTEFFLIRLKDKYAASGLYGYANAAHIDDPEYAGEIEELAKRAGPVNPHCKQPD